MLINPTVPAGGRSAELMKNCHVLPALWAAVTGSAILGLFQGLCRNIHSGTSRRPLGRKSILDQSLSNYLLCFPVPALCQALGD